MKEHSRRLILHESDIGHNGSAAAKNIFEVHEEIISVSQCQRWIKKFRGRHCSIKDEPHAVRLDK